MTSTYDILNAETTFNCNTCLNNVNNKCSIRKAIACWWTKEYKYYEPAEPFLKESDVMI